MPILIVCEYVDRAKSGTNSEREAFQQMLKESSAGTFQAVIVHKLDRFARNRYDSAVCKKVLAENGIKLISVYERFDDSPESIILEGLMEALNEYYSANLAREVMKGMRENALACKYTGGVIPLGYSVGDDGRYVINEDEARIVRKIFREVLAGKGYNEIIAELNSMGAKTRKGGTFGKNSLFSILTNEKYGGTYVYNREVAKNSAGKRNSHRFKEDSEVIRIDDGVPPIVTKAEFEAVQNLMNSRKQKRRIAAESTARETYILAGKVYCGECGGKYCGNKRKAGRSGKIYQSYRCNVRTRKGRLECHNSEISRACLEKYVLHLLADVLFDEERLPEIIAEYNRKINFAEADIAAEIKHLSNTLRGKETEIQNLIQVMAKTGSVALTEALSEREHEADRIRTEITNLKQRTTRVDIDLEVIKRAFAKGRKLLESGDLPNLKQLVELYVDRVIVYPDNISVTLNIMQGLKAIEKGNSLSNLNSTYDGAFEIKTDADRKTVLNI